MFWYYLLFAPAMILTPGLIALVMRKRPAEAARRQRANRLSILFWSATCAALAAFAITYYFSPTGATFLWVLTFPLWALLMVLLNARQSEASGTPAARQDGSVVRTASLTNRARLRPVPGWSWALPGVIVLCGLAGIVARWLRPMSVEELTLWLMGLGFGVWSAISVPFAAWVTQRSLIEPEPLDPAGSPELTAAWAARRTSRARTFFWFFGVVMPVVWTGIGLSAAWIPATSEAGMWLGIAGGIVGSIVGVAGGIFGTIFGIRQARILAQQRALTERSSSAV